MGTRSGDAVDPAEAAACSGTDEAARFMTRSSEGRRVAAVAAGVDEQAAHDAAARTTAARTGAGAAG